MNDDKIMTTDYLHPMDKVLSAQILGFPVIKQLLDYVHKQKLDDVNYYLYNSSCIKLPSEHPAVAAFRDGKERFGVTADDNVFVVRDYNFDVRVFGYSNPVVLVSSRLLEENRAFLLKERVAVAAASIAAQHHKLDFLLFIYNNILK